MLSKVFARRGEFPCLRIIPEMAAFEPLRVRAGALTLGGEVAGEGRPVVLLHGLTATRRYVVMGSKLLEKGGFRVIGYDARGHGESSPAPDASAYEYRDLVSDLLAVIDEAGV